jgi:hypothetical protein
MIPPKKFFYTALISLLLILSPIRIGITPTPVDGSIFQTSNVAEARTRIDHGLPMTRIPYRYSAYLFLLAIVVTQMYRTYRRDRQTPRNTSFDKTFA